MAKSNRNQTIWDYAKENWIIKKSRIKEIGINPNKDFDDITYKELCFLADELDVMVSDLF